MVKLGREIGLEGRTDGFCSGAHSPAPTLTQEASPMQKPSHHLWGFDILHERLPGISMEVSESASGAILSMGFWQTSRKLCRSPSCPPPQPVFACISFSNFTQLT